MEQKSAYQMEDREVIAEIDRLKDRIDYLTKEDCFLLLDLKEVALQRGILCIDNNYLAEVNAYIEKWR